MIDYNYEFYPTYTDYYSPEYSLWGDYSNIYSMDSPYAYDTPFWTGSMYENQPSLASYYPDTSGYDWGGWDFDLNQSPFQNLAGGGSFLSDYSTNELFGGGNPSYTLGANTSLAEPPAGDNQSFLRDIGSKVYDAVSSNPIGALTSGLGAVLAIYGMTMDDGGKIKLPDNRTIQLSPEEQQFMNLIMKDAAAKSGVSGPILEALAAAAQNSKGQLQNAAQLGVSNLVDLLQQDAGGGNDLITDLYGSRVVKALLGEGDSDPKLQRELGEQFKTFQDRMYAEGGPGAGTSTWFNKAMQDLQQRQDETKWQSDRNIMTQDNESRIRSMLANQNVLDSRTNRLGQTGILGLLTGQSPVASAATGLGALSPIGNQQAQNNLLSQQFNIAKAQQDRNQLLNTGGNFLGYGLGQYQQQNQLNTLLRTLGRG